MAGGYGNSPYGASPYGGSHGDTFDLLGAGAPNNTSVDLTFSYPLNPVDPIVLDPASYEIPGITIIGVSVTGSRFIRLYVSSLTDGVLYTARVVAPVYQDADGDDIDNREATFLGVGSTVQCIVSNLQARTWCGGNRISLSWTNPTGARRVKIVRRTRSWPFDLTDAHDVLYDSETIINSFMDPPLTPDDPPSLMSQLLEGQTYYYYLVLVSTAPSPPSWDYDISGNSRVFALSIAEMNSKDEFFWKTTPADARRFDHMSTAEGGGAGTLDQFYAVMGCWLNLMRGHMNAIQLLANGDQAPYPAVLAQVESYGTTPEGESYDFSISRRQLLSQMYVYKRRGTCPGIVESVRMFTLWDAICSEVGLGDGCQIGASSLRTWDGQSEEQWRVLGADPVLEFLSADGRARYREDFSGWVAGQWDGGKLIGPTGDVACIEVTDLDTLSRPYVDTKAPRIVTTATASVNIGATMITVASTVGLRPGLTIQLSGLIDGTLFPVAEIFEVASVVGPTSFTITRAVSQSFENFPTLSVGKSIFRRAYLIVATPIPGNSFVQVVGARYVENQWKNYTADLGDGVPHTVLSNTGDTIYFTPALGGAPGPREISITNSKYRITNGAHSFTFEPTFDMEARGTMYDTFSRLWQGSGVAIQGVWGPTDLAIYILSNVTVTMGRAAGVTGSIIDLDPLVPPPTAGSLVGMYLNPNQNQEQTFEIIGNSTTQIQVEGNISSLVVVGQFYYVLRPRDRNRFLRLSKRLNREYAHQDIRPHVLFM